MKLKRYPIAKLDQLEEGQGLAFQVEHDGESIEGFLVNFEGDLFAYRNRCVHVPMRVDGKEPGVFFEGGGRRLRCQTHGATFRPDTGECLAGPQGCPGEYLAFLALAADEDQVFVVLRSKDEAPPEAKSGPETKPESAPFPGPAPEDPTGVR